MRYLHRLQVHTDTLATPPTPYLLITCGSGQERTMSDRNIFPQTSSRTGSYGGVYFGFLSPCPIGQLMFTPIALANRLPAIHHA